MYPWTLILLFVNIFGNESTSMTTVPNFVSEATCRAAAQQAEAKFTMPRTKQMYTLCVKTN